MNTTNPWSAKRTATGPFGNPHGKAHDFGNFDAEALEHFWDTWVSHWLFPFAACGAYARYGRVLVSDVLS
jgi:hypothetical protein